MTRPKFSNDEVNEVMRKYGIHDVRYTGRVNKRIAYGPGSYTLGYSDDLYNDLRVMVREEPVLQLCVDETGLSKMFGDILGNQANTRSQGMSTYMPRDEILRYVSDTVARQQKKSLLEAEFPPFRKPGNVINKH